MSTDGQRSTHTTEATAAFWAACLADAPDAANPALEEWLRENPAHAGALLRARALLALVGASGPAASDTSPAEPEPLRRHATAKRWAGLGMACAAAAAILMLVNDNAHSYRTGTGEMRQIALDDGSALTIDAQSRMRVDLDEHEREVTLKAGRALFRVAHDAARPFRVVVGDITITDIGTVFSVSQSGDEVHVLVKEGEVAIAGPAAPMRIKAGQSVYFRHGQPAATQVLSPAVIEHALAWTSGGIELDGDTLASAIAEMNRHNHRQIRLIDPALGREKLYGAFRLDDPQTFAQAAALGLGAPLSTKGDDIVIGAK